MSFMYEEEIPAVDSFEEEMDSSDKIARSQWQEGQRRALIVPASQPRDIQAMGLDEIEDPEMVLNILEMRSSYIDAASVLPDDYLNTRIIVLGCWLNDVPAGETATNEHYEAFTQLLLKIAETDKKDRHIIIRTSARQALSDAEIWLKCFGWGDWKQPVSFEVVKNGQRISFRMVR